MMQRPGGRLDHRTAHKDMPALPVCLAVEGGWPDAPTVPPQPMAAPLPLGGRESVRAPGGNGPLGWLAATTAPSRGAGPEDQPKIRV